MGKVLSNNANKKWVQQKGGQEGKNLGEYHTKMVISNSGYNDVVGCDHNRRSPPHRDTTYTYKCSTIPPCAGPHECLEIQAPIRKGLIISIERTQDFLPPGLLFAPVGEVAWVREAEYLTRGISHYPPLKSRIGTKGHHTPHTWRLDT